MITSSTLKFLKALKKNNNKEWFDANRKTYTTTKENFEEFVRALLEQMALFDEDLIELSAKECIFRINRDLRFSNDKTPYKVNRSAYFSKGGKKSIYAGYYIHMQPGGNSFLGGGIWMPQSAELNKIRQEIDYCFPEFRKIITKASFKKQFGKLEKDESRMLVNVPKGYEKENPAADFLRLKSFLATRNFTDTEVISPDFVAKVAQSFKALIPLVKFINRGLE